MSDFSFDNMKSDDLDNVPTKASRARQEFPCSECNGTGRYLGRRTVQEKAHCFACKGKGFFLTDKFTRAKSKEKAQARKAEQLRTVIESFKSENPGVWEYLEKAASFGNEFHASILDQLRRGRSLSEKQVAVVRMKFEGWTARKAEAAAAREAAPKVECDLSPIRAMFEAASGNGYKRPVYRAEGVVISLAAASGRNPGALYVKADEGDAYLGKIVGTVYQPTREGEAFKAALAAIAADPKGAAIRYGQRTGRCACCGRELTNHNSIDLGIGPICAQKWGF